MFNNKILLITGGTGSFGNAVLEKFIDSELKEIRIFSRDELKQDNMRKKYNNSKLNFFVGDSSNPEFKSFLISSIPPSEGKTFTSINLSKIV